MRWITSTLLLVALSSANAALAHPGHGMTDPQSITHQVVEPVHAVPWLLLIAIGVILAGTTGLLWRRQHRGRAVAAASDRRRPTAGRE